MKTHIITLAAVLCCLFQSCSEAPGKKLLSISKAKEGRNEVLFLGDSLTEGYGVTPDQAFPGIIQNKWASGKLPFRVIPAGASGSTSAGALERGKIFISASTLVLFLEIGINDALDKEPIEQIRSNISSIIDLAVSNGAGVVLARVSAEPSMLDNDINYCVEYNNLFDDLSKDGRAVLYPNFLGPLLTSPMEKYFLSDQVHPNPDGHQVLAKNIRSFLGY